MAIQIGNMTSGRPMIIYTQCSTCRHQEVEKVPQGSGYSTKPCAKCGSTGQNMQIGLTKPKWWEEVGHE